MLVPVVLPTLPGSYLVLETTNRCSLTCVHCTVSERGHPHHARTGFLPVALAEGLFADLAGVGARFDALVLFWLGEPLLHPDFGAIYRAALRVAGERGVFGQIEVHTNATHLDADRVRLALNASPVRQVWHLSLDAATPETYRRVKGADRFALVDAQVEAFLAERARRRARWPRPVLQFIVGENNAAEVPAFRARWEALCRRVGTPARAAAQLVPGGEDPVVFFRQLDCPTPEEQARQNAAFRAAMAREGLALPREDRSTVAVDGVDAGEGSICACFWKSPVVGWDGSVTVCTRDNSLENALGNLRDAPFSALWWGPTMRARREQVARRDYRGLAACRGCFVPRSANSGDVGADEIAAYAAASS